MELTKKSISKWAYIILKFFVTVGQIVLFLANCYWYSEHLGFFFVGICIILVQTVSAFIGMLTYKYKFPEMMYWEFGIFMTAAVLYTILTFYNISEFNKSKDQELYHQHGNKTYESGVDEDYDYMKNATLDDPMETLTINAIDSLTTARKNFIKYLTGTNISEDESSKINSTVFVESSKESVDTFYQTSIFKFLLKPSYIVIGIQFLVLVSVIFYRFCEISTNYELQKDQIAAINRSSDNASDLEKGIQPTDLKKDVSKSKSNIPAAKPSPELGECSKAIASQAQKALTVTFAVKETYV